MIPKIIHQVTFGKVPNTLIAECLKSWQILTLNGFKIITWNYEQAIQFINQNFNQALDTFRTARNLGEASDIFRYIIICFYGGYYVDWDIKLTDLQKFLCLDIKNQDGILLIDPKNGSISCEFLSATKGDLFLYENLYAIIDTYKRGKRELMNTPQYSGPYRLQNTLKNFGNTKQSIVLIKEAFEFDYWEIYKSKEPDIPTRPMIHFWLNSWISNS